MIRAVYRHLLIAMGFVFLALGLIGIVLPLLPTTPFVLLAAFCFSRGSERLHHWLLSRPHLGPLIHDWERYGMISVRAKVLSTIMMWAMVSYPIFNPRISLSAKGLMVLTSVCVSAFVLSRPSRKPEESSSEA